MTKGLVRADARGFLKILIASVMVATQCITITPGIRGQAQDQPVVDLPSFAGKSMGDIIQQIKKPRKCWEFNRYKEVMLPGEEPFVFDDLCHFKIGSDSLRVYSYRGRAIAFSVIFGISRIIRGLSKPEDALLRIGINVNGTKPLIQDPSERSFQMERSAIFGSLAKGTEQDIVWYGTFNETSWKELRVVQDLKGKKGCYMVLAIVSDNIQ